MIENFQNIEVLNLEKRSKIIDKPNRNEVILLHVKAMKFEWKQYADFEKNHRAEGREIIVLLPEEMLGDLIQLKKTCDALAKRGIGESRDYEYVIRWNNKLATLHLLFSERKKMLVERQKSIQEIFGMIKRRIDKLNLMLKTRNLDMKRELSKKTAMARSNMKDLLF
ncbi:hypothetical protein [Vagococcus carniphilus]|uniref:hypothetical protein n=1 Tax=Vagococcus carniphilus TaxID=218144 RepID=UPI003BA9D78B